MDPPFPCDMPSTRPAIPGKADQLNPRPHRPATNAPNSSAITPLIVPPLSTAKGWQR